MSAQPVDVTQRQDYPYLFTFATLVTRKQEYLEMVDSARQAGFDRDDVEFIYIDNSDANRFDGFSGANHFLSRAKGRYLVFCHQDVLFEHDNCDHLIQKLEQLSALDPNWALAGNSGKQADSRVVQRISEPHGQDKLIGELPSPVVSLDENLIVINRKAQIGCTRSLSGFHLYGTDLCFNARQLGYGCYVIDFHLTHKSEGTVGEAYHQARLDVMKNYNERKMPEVVQSMCSRFYVSSSAIANRVYNRKALLNLYSSLAKKRTK